MESITEERLRENMQHNAEGLSKSLVQMLLRLESGTGSCKQILELARDIRFILQVMDDSYTIDKYGFDSVYGDGSIPAL